MVNCKSWLNSHKLSEQLLQLSPRRYIRWTRSEGCPVTCFFICLRAWADFLASVYLSICANILLTYSDLQVKGCITITLGSSRSLSSDDIISFFPVLNFCLKHLLIPCVSVKKYINVLKCIEIHQVWKPSRFSSCGSNKADAYTQTHIHLE